MHFRRCAIATEKISIPIETSYKDAGAKAALKDIEKIDKAKPKFEVEADTKKADRDIAGLLTKVDKLGAEPASILLASNASQIANEILDLITDIDKLDASDPTVDVKAERIAALTADLDTVQSKIKEINSTSVDIDTRPAVDGIHKVRDSSDQSRSVLANMVGNASQDLGALGGVAGTAGVALGQLGEYAAEGGISLGSLAKVAGPMAGLALATALVSDALAGINAEKAFRAKLVEDFTKALREGETAVESIHEQIEETGRLAFETGFGGGGGFLGLKSQTKDILPLVKEAGLGYGAFFRVIEGGEPALGRLRDAWNAESAASVEQVNARKKVIEGLDQYITSAAEAEEQNRAYNEVQMALNTELLTFEGRLAATRGVLDKNTEAAGDLGVGLNRMSIRAREAMDTVVDESEDAVTAVDKVTFAAQATEEQFGRLRTGLQMEAAVNTFKVNFLTATAQVQQGVGLTSDEILGLKNDILNVAEYAKLNPVQVQALLDAVDQGNVAGVMQLVQNQLDRNPAEWRVDLVPGRISPTLASIRQAERDRGGFVGPEGALAAERRPEFVRLPGGQEMLLLAPSFVPSGTQVTSGAETERILREREREMYSAPTNVTINVPRGSRPDDVMRAADRYARRNGRSRAHRR